MKNSVCVICGKEFDEPREGKLYCSDSCAQYAYRKRKESNLSGTDEPEGIKTPEVKYKIDYVEYCQFLVMFSKKFNKERLKDINIIKYSFFRKNLSGISDIKFIYDYIIEVCFNQGENLFQILTEPENFDLEQMNLSIVVKKYKEFLSLYHSGGVEIINNIDSTKKPKNTLSA